MARLGRSFPTHSQLGHNAILAPLSISAAGNGAFSFSGSATGTVPESGTGTFAFSGTAAGTNPLAPYLVQSAHVNVASVISTTISLSGVSTGDLLTMSVYTSNGAEVASIIDNNGDLWIRGCNANATNSLDNEMWYASGVIGLNLGASVTAASVTLTATAGSDFTCVLCEWANISSVNAMDQEVPNGGTGSTATAGANLQGFEANTLFLTTVTSSVANVSSYPSGWASVATGRNFDGMAYYVDLGASTHDPSWGLASSQNWLTSTISFITPLENAPAYNTSVANLPQVHVEYSSTPSPFVPLWRNIARFTESIKTTQGRQHELDRIEAGTIDLTLDNRSGDFNPWNTSSILYNAGYGLAPMNAIRISAAWEGVTYYIAYGYVQSITPQLADVLNNDCDIKCFDALQFLSLRYLSGTNYASLIEAESTLCAYWRLGDSVGSYTSQTTSTISQLFDSTPASNTGYGPFAGTLISGIGGIPMLGAQGILLYDSDGALDCTNGTNSPNGGFGAGGPINGSTRWTYETWMQWTDDLSNLTASSVATETLYTTTCSAGEVDIRCGAANIVAGITTYGTIVLYINGSAVSTSNAAVMDNNFHHVAMSASVGGGNTLVNLYLDGILDSGVSGVYNKNLTVSSGSNGSVFGCNAGPTNGFAGILDEVALYNSVLSASDILNHYQTGYWFRADDIGAGTSGTSSGRLNKVLAVAGFPGGLTSIGQSFKTPVYGETNPLITSTALDYIQIQTETEPGLIFQGQDGNIYALNRQYVVGAGAPIGIMNPSRAYNSQGVFGDVSGATFAPEYKNLDIGADDLDVWNDIQAQSARPSTPAPVLQEWAAKNDARALASSNLYGTRTLQGLTSLLFLYDSDALAIAQWYLTIYCAAQVRSPDVTLQQTYNSGANLPQMLGRTLYDQITLEYQGQTAGSEYTGNGVIESIAHDVDILTGIWQTTFVTSPYEIHYASGVSNGQLVVAEVTPTILGTYRFGAIAQLTL